MTTTKQTSRIAFKSDTSANWAKAKNFTPLKGEPIHYSDVNRIKIGDGIANVNDLPFATMTPDEIENLFASWAAPVESGEGEFSIVQSGASARAISQGAVALGNNTLAGSRGFAYDFKTVTDGFDLIVNTIKGNDTTRYLSECIDSPELFSVTQTLPNAVYYADITRAVSTCASVVRPLRTTLRIAKDNTTGITFPYVSAPSYSSPVQTKLIAHNVPIGMAMFMKYRLNHGNTPTANLHVEIAYTVNGKDYSVSFGDVSAADLARRHAGWVVGRINVKGELNRKGLQAGSIAEKITITFSHQDALDIAYFITDPEETNANTMAYVSSMGDEYYMHQNTVLGSYIADQWRKINGNTGVQQKDPFTPPTHDIEDISNTPEHSIETFYIDASQTGALPDSLTAGAQCTIITNNEYVGKPLASVIAVDRFGNTITVDGTPMWLLKFNTNDLGETTRDPDAGWETKTPYKKTIKIDADPEAGNNEIGMYAFAWGKEAEASGYNALALGREARAMGSYAVAEGRETVALYGAHAEGYLTQARGHVSHAEGFRTIASNTYAHAEGNEAQALGGSSHAEGYKTIAEGDCAHAEGSVTQALGDASKSEGINTIARGRAAHASGLDSAAGAFGFKFIEAIPDKDNLTTTYVISHVQDVAAQLTELKNATINLSIGPVVSLIYKNHYDLCAKVVAIEIGDTTSSVTIDKLLTDTLSSEATATNSLNTIRFPDYPTYGTIDIGEGAFAQGRGTASLGEYAHAEGYQSRALGKAAHAEGRGTEAVFGAHAEGWYTQAHGQSSHTEGGSTITESQFAHAEGSSTGAHGFASHAEGEGTHAYAHSSHTEGGGTQTSGNGFSHAEGMGTQAGGTAAQAAHAEGIGTNASADASHAEGYYTEAFSEYAHAEGSETKAHKWASHAEGSGSVVDENADAGHAEGVRTHVTGWGGHAEGEETEAGGRAAHAEGGFTHAMGDYTHAEGNSTRAYGDCAHAEGEYSYAVGKSAHAEGYNTHVGGLEFIRDTEGNVTETIINGLAHYGHSEGFESSVRGNAAHAEGHCTIANAEYSHAEGNQSITGVSVWKIKEIYSGNVSLLVADPNYTFPRGTATNYYCKITLLNHNPNYFKITGLQDYGLQFALGVDKEIEGSFGPETAEYDINSITLFTQDEEGKYIPYICDAPILGGSSHVEGLETRAFAEGAHAEGKYTLAIGRASHASGIGTIADVEAQTVVGKYNQTKSQALFVVGNGTDINTRSNAFEVLSDASIKIGSTVLTEDKLAKLIKFIDSIEEVTE